MTEQREEMLLEALAMIARMKVYPDNKLNRFTLVAAVNLAADTIEAVRALGQTARDEE